jgi:hypothetical protein
MFKRATIITMSAAIAAKKKIKTNKNDKMFCGIERSFLIRTNNNRMQSLDDVSVRLASYTRIPIVELVGLTFLVLGRVEGLES